jgi:CheY-like chemotaxis protein
MALRHFQHGGMHQRFRISRAWCWPLQHVDERIEQRKNLPGYGACWPTGVERLLASNLKPVGQDLVAVLAQSAGNRRDVTALSVTLRSSRYHVRRHDKFGTVLDRRHARVYRAASRPASIRQAAGVAPPRALYPTSPWASPGMLVAASTARQRVAAGGRELWHVTCRLGVTMTRILIVDDDAAVRSVVSQALAQDGYEVDAVANGRQALAAFREHPPDALVLDLEMPVMDGPTLMHSLRERPEWGRVPLVVVSGTDGAGEAAPRLGARACLRKPFDLSDLVHTIKQVAPPT